MCCPQRTVSINHTAEARVWYGSDEQNTVALRSKTAIVIKGIEVGVSIGPGVLYRDVDGIGDVVERLRADGARNAKKAQISSAVGVSVCALQNIKRGDRVV